MDKFWKKLADALEMIVPIVFPLLGAFAVYVFYSGDFSDRPVLTASVFMAVLIELFVFIILRIRRRKETSDVYKLAKWIKYDKKRKEIEEQMDRLYAELTDSDTARYVDLNRLVFLGQPNTGEIQTNYSDAFLRQFGLDQKQIKVEENAAAFLTPFNAEGDKLYQYCKQVLLDGGITLRRSDDFYAKDDILMNIVSLIVRSEFIVANIDGRNPNVYYELGIAHAIGKNTILISRGDRDLMEIPIDLRQKRIILYETEEDLAEKLTAHVRVLKS